MPLENEVDIFTKKGKMINMSLKYEYIFNFSKPIFLLKGDAGP